MSRLEKKCLVASAGMHALLFLVLALAPLFWVVKTRPPVLPAIQFIPSRIVDGAMGGGGSPQAKTTPTPPQAAPVQVVAPPAAPKAAPVPPKAEPKPAREDAELAPKPKRRVADAILADKTLPIVKPDDPEDASDGKSGKGRVQISLKRAGSSPSSRASSNGRVDRQNGAASARAAFLAKIGSAVEAISEGASSGTVIDVLGPGGEAYADYGQAVVAIYYRAWAPPSELADDMATVTVRVVILRDGTVKSFEVIKTSRHPALDRSVERLQSVQKIERFPEGSRDESRTFIIDFNLHSRK